MSEWISIKDRLPDYDVDVLTIDINTGEHRVATRPYFSNDAWCYGVCGPVNLEFYPTHWMPLPEPPGMGT
ncbi:TPA: DUF551 domain-containing protein [Enterobacter roggenkampii]|nr:DUF551 domain-containing protein [Enterobacter roggenkampii]